MAVRIHRGLTMIDVLVGFAVIVVILGFLLPSIQRVRIPAQRMKCNNNLKQLSVGLNQFAERHQYSHYPNGEYSGSWIVDILPYLETQKHKVTPGQPMQLLICPARRGVDSTTNYFALSGIVPDAAELPGTAPVNGFMGYHRKTTPEMITDGLSNTIALRETNLNLGSWSQRGEATLRSYPLHDRPSLDSAHEGVVLVAFADGSVRHIRLNIKPAIFASLVTIAGRDSVSNWDD